MALFVFKRSCKEEYIKVLRFFVTITGLWPIEKCKGEWLYHLHAFAVSYMVSFLFMVTLTIDIYLSLGDLAATADASYYFITELTFFIKFSIFVAKRKGFPHLLDSLEDPIYSSAEYSTPEKYWSKLATSYSRAFFCCCFGSSVFFGVFPVLEKDEDNILPFRGWFPFDVKYSLANRGIVYGLQMFGMCIAISLNASLDLLPPVFMNIACAQIEVLQHTLENAIHRAGEIVAGKNCQLDSIHTTSNLGQDDENVEQLSIEHDNAVHDILSHCVQHQLAIIKFLVLTLVTLKLPGSETVISMYLDVIRRTLIKDVEHFFSSAMFIQFVSSGCSITITCLQLIVVPYSLKYLAVISYLAAMTFEVSLYCWNGHQIIIQSSNIGESCYNMEWYRCSARVKKTIFIIMERSKIPIRMTAGGFFTLSIETLTAIFRTSYSYFAVLRRIYGGDK